MYLPRGGGGASCKEAQRTLAGQALKAIFALNKYLYKFTYLKPSHVIDVFDKLISPILNYGSEVWGFHNASAIEIVHMQFCKNLLGVKQSAQNDFVYGELGRLIYQVQRYISIVRYWLKIINLEENKYVKCIYNMMIQDIQLFPNKQIGLFMLKPYCQYMALETYGKHREWKTHKAF